jgi:2-oxo-4-hydroxy-4-carboxy-5-ureidoimidazoline decarboxylase
VIAIDALNAADRDQFAAALGDIFEHAPWVAHEAHAARPFPTLAALLAAMAEAVRSAAPAQQLALIKGHPDLAGKAARAGTITTDSQAEQASAGLDRLSKEELARFQRLNSAYVDKFGIPFIICVRRHTKDSIFRQFERRLHNDQAAEHDAALSEILRIAALRLDGRVSAPDRLKVHGRLSTHVLDAHGGQPAAGVPVELVEVSGTGDIRPIAQAVTNHDGRTDRPLIDGRPIPIGAYELRFAVGDYFARRGTPVADPAFLDVVLVRFSVADPEDHYHVPLLATPWSYTTYRGT